MGNAAKGLALGCKHAYVGDERGHNKVWVAGREELRKTVCAVIRVSDRLLAVKN